MQTLMIKVSDGINDEIPAYFAPSKSPNSPAIILIHEVWGLTEHIKDIARRFAEAGYNVLAPDLLSGTEVASLLTPELIKDISDPKKRAERQVELRAIMAPISSPEFSAETTKKLNICFRFLSHEHTISKIGSVGYCFGGTYTFALAVSQPKLAAAVAYYGHCDCTQDQINKINCPVLAFYGENDSRLIDKLPELQAEMKAGGKDFAYKVYEKTGHAFFNDTNPATYNAKAAKNSWEMTLQFLEINLK